MHRPPRKYRMITPLLTVSGPLSPENVDFLKQGGCRKILSIGGGFIHPDVVPHVKKNQMEVMYYPFPDCSDLKETQESLKRVFSQLTHLIESGSRVHVAGDVSLTDVACLVGAIRKLQDWELGNILSEAIDISDSVEVSDLISAIHSFDAVPRSLPFNTGGLKNEHA